MAFRQPPPPPPPGGHPAKIQIPRLDRPREPPKKPPAQRKPRVSRACLSCRARKIKCDGAQPRCRNCVDSTVPCEYAASRKDRLKIATEHNQDLLQLLQELRHGASPDAKQKIDHILAATTDDVAEAASALRKDIQRSPDKHPAVAPEDGSQDEAEVSAEVGSNEDLDNMNEDIMRTAQSRATGYLGKNSEVQWLKTLHYEAENKDPNAQVPYGPSGNSEEAHRQRLDAMHERHEKSSFPPMDTSSCSFYLDEEPLHIDFPVDPTEVPPFETAERLLKSYMQTVQNSFPLLSQQTFTKQFYHYYDSVSRGTPYKLPQKWQAMLNLVLAIGAVHSHLAEADWVGDERDHLIYHNRAWALSLKDPWWLTHPDLAQMQITGLLSFYYMSIGHVNRSWVVVGMSMRFGFSLGLHIRNEDRNASLVKKEILSRIWWAVFSLDRTLSALTGRPSVGAQIYCSTPLPLPVAASEITEAAIAAKFGQKPRWIGVAVTSPSETNSPSLSNTGPPQENASASSEPPNAGTFLAATVALGMVSNTVLTRLYSPNLVTKSWKDVQHSISQLLEDLEAWLNSLHSGLDPFKDNGSDHTMQHERNLLKTYYFSTKILICRPCLCRLDRRIRSQTQSSDNFNHEIAAQCVVAAKSVAACLPDDMAVWRKAIYKILPWWSAVHYLMQSMAILLLETCYEAEGMTIMPTVKKLVRWLRELKSTNRTAERAYSVTVGLIKKMALRKFKDPKTADDFSDLLAEDPEPEPYESIALDPSTYWLTGEEFLEQPSLPQDLQAGNEAYTVPNFAGGYSSVGVFPGATDLPLQGFFHEALNSNSPLANVFLTGFDQHNPLPLQEDSYMQDIGGAEQMDHAYY